jgi:hypothetical protein
VAEELKIISASGVIGYGFPEDSLARGMQRNPDVIGCDAGSTDAGPYYLGAGAPMLSYASCKRDTELLTIAARKAKIPLIIGSAGIAGGTPHLHFMVNIIKNIARENNLHFKLAIINSEQDKEFLKLKLQQGRVTTMDLSEPNITSANIEEAERIVGVMGVEPYIKALDMGAEVIIAGRSTDTAIFASVPIKAGFDPGLSWHAGKILECGAISAEPARGGDCILVTLRKDDFIVEPLNPFLRHTTLSTAAHALYENINPYQMREPGGTLDLSKVKYEQYNERAVRVTGAQFFPSGDYRVKLEWVTKIGYRTIAIIGVRCPILIKQIDNYLKEVRNTVREKVKEAFYGEIGDSDYMLEFRVYGRNAIMKEREPIKETSSHELGIVIEVVAKDQELSKTVCSIARTYCVHHDFPGRLSLAGNVAVAFSPGDIPVGPAYIFNRELLVSVDDPCELFGIDMIDL